MCPIASRRRLVAEVLAYRLKSGWRWLEPGYAALIICLRCDYRDCEVHLDTPSLPLAVCKKCGPYPVAEFAYQHDWLPLRELELIQAPYEPSAPTAGPPAKRKAAWQGGSQERTSN